MKPAISYEGLTHVSFPPNAWSKVVTEGPEILQPTYHDVSDSLYPDFVPELIISPFKQGSGTQLTAANLNVDVYSSMNGGVCFLPAPQRASIYYVFNSNLTAPMNMLRIPAYDTAVQRYFMGPMVGNYWKQGNNVNGASNVDLTIAGLTTIYLADWYRVCTYIQNVSGTGAIARIAVGPQNAAANIGFQLQDGDSIILEASRQRITAFNQSGSPVLACQAFML